MANALLGLALIQRYRRVNFFGGLAQKYWSLQEAIFASAPHSSMLRLLSRLF